MATTLAISHNIFLTPEERDCLLKEDGHVKVVGVSVPVWHHTGVTSEPAVEVYVMYEINNKKDVIYIKQNDEGYEMQIPPDTGELEKLPDDVWDSLTTEEQDRWWEQHEPGPSLSHLKDIKNGGSEWLAFRQYSKVKRNKKTLSVIHYVEVKLMQDLMETLS